MAHIKGRDLRRRMMEELRNSGRQVGGVRNLRLTETMQEFCEKGLALDEKNHRIDGRRPQIDFAQDTSVRELAEELIVNRSDGEPVGSRFIETYFAAEGDLIRLQEDGALDAVDFSMFKGITGQLVVNSILERAESEEYIFTRITKSYPTKFVSGERIPGVSPPKRPDQGQPGVGDILLRKENEPFRYFGFGEEYIDIPETQQRGGIVPITRLAVYADRTGLIAEQAGEVGDIVAYDKECRGWDMLIGLNGYQFKEKRMVDGSPVTIDPYQTVAGSSAGQLACTTNGTWGAANSLSNRPYPFVNDLPANPLGTDGDYTAVQACDIQFNLTHDPSTGRPVKVGKPFIIATYSRNMDIARILQAVNVWKITQQGLNTVGAINTVSPNPLAVLGQVDYRVSRQLRDQLVAAGCTGVGESPNPDKVWFYGDVAKAIKYAENWPIRVIQAPVNSEAEFMQDIFIRFRADERGGWIWTDPRVLQRVNYQSQA